MNYNRLGFILLPFFFQYIYFKKDINKEKFIIKLFQFTVFCIL